MQRKIPCVLMRGGTSRGPYFLASDLPADPGRRDAVLLSVMGSPHALQVDGVTEPAAAIKLTFLDALGAVTGKLLPTGSTLDRIDGIDASCVDMAMPVMIMAAEAFGKTGRETPEELDED